MNSQHVLIIEDEFFIAFSIEDALRRHGFQSFAIAASQDEAVNAAKEQCPDLILADYNLIDGNGVDAVLRICSERSIPVLFVTANGDVVRERLPGAPVVNKPFEEHTLGEGLKQAQGNPFGPAATTFQ